MEVYLDNNATTKPLPCVVEAIKEALDTVYGNASSAHQLGEIARQKIFTAREQLARLLDLNEEQLYFTSSGTEANNLALASVKKYNPQDAHLITTKVEHSSVIKYCEHLELLGYGVTYLDVTGSGRVNTDELRRQIKDETKLISMQWVNNETGVIQPIEDIQKIAKKHSIPIHTDAAQALGKMDLTGLLNDFDFLTCTAHKIHGPQGVGAIYIKNKKQVENVLYGGGQEGAVRPGTENLIGIVGFGAAAEARYKGLNTIITIHGNLRDTFETQLFEKVSGVHVNGENANRVNNTTNLRFEGVDGQALVAQLGHQDIYSSQSSACTNMTPEPSYVLTAMGMSSEEAYASVRFSFSELNDESQIAYAVEEISKAVERIRRLSGYKNSSAKLVAGGFS